MGDGREPRKYWGERQKLPARKVKDPVAQKLVPLRILLLILGLTPNCPTD